MRCSSPLYIAIIRFGYSGVPVVPFVGITSPCDNFLFLYSILTVQSSNIL